MSDPLRRLAPVVRLAPAKLNLTLAVGGRRADGYHALHSVMVPLALADRLALAATPDAADSLHVTGFDPGPARDNLVLRAIAAARRAARPRWPLAPADPPALAVRLDKYVPVAAGLAGGSSDAAAALLGALEAWQSPLPGDELRDLAASLGSDVPFFLAGYPGEPRPALVTGRGENVTALRGPVGPPPGILIVSPRLGLSTGDVFAAFAAGARPAVPGSARAASEHLAGELSRGLASAALLDRAGVLAAANDLLPAAQAVEPGLVAFRRGLARLLRRPIGQSGSGPTAWVLYASDAEAEAAASLVRTAATDGLLAVPGGGEPFVTATRIAGLPADPRAVPPAEPGPSAAAGASAVEVDVADVE